MAEYEPHIADAARTNTRARFEQWVQNPSCTSNVLSTVHNVGMDKAAKQLGYESQFKQSSFAVTRGIQFEAGLFKNNAEMLIKALRRVKALRNRDIPDFLDLRLKMNGGNKINSIEGAIKATIKVLSDAANNQISNITIVAGALIKIPKGILLPEATLIIDVLIITPKRDDQTQITVGEIKIFPDRGGNTDVSQLASARAQAGVYIHGLELVLKMNNWTTDLTIRNKGFLVFTWPGSNAPVVRWDEDLKWQTQRASVGFDQLEKSAQGLFEDAQKSLTQEELVNLIISSSKTYNSSCIKFCDLNRYCFNQALNESNPIILGDDAARLFHDMTLIRVSELSKGAEPKNAREEEVQKQLLAKAPLPKILGRA